MVHLPSGCRNCIVRTALADLDAPPDQRRPEKTDNCPNNGTPFASIAWRSDTTIESGAVGAPRFKEYSHEEDPEKGSFGMRKNSR